MDRSAPFRRGAIRWAPAVFALLAIACGASNPTEPSAVPQTAAGSSASPGAPAGSRPVNVPPERIVTSAVSFPPRNETFLFRQDLEAEYRDGLRRSPSQTFVDLEGDIVWIQEYLRYRVNGCTHPDASSRVFAQIDGASSPAVCSPTSTLNFPPRDEPLDFRLQLEAKYRDGLKRPPNATFVDTEGDIVWDQEYLRYRVSGCPHPESETKVFQQIDGGGIQPDCRPAGTAQITNVVDVFGINGHPFSVLTNGLLTMTLAWSDPSVDLDLYLTDSSCSAYPPSECVLLAVSVAPTGTAEQVSRNVAAGERFIVWVDNLSDTQSQSYTIMFGSGVSTEGAIARRASAASRKSAGAKRVR